MWRSQGSDSSPSSSTLFTYSWIPLQSCPPLFLERLACPQRWEQLLMIINVLQFSSAQSCPTLCDPMNCSTPGLPVHHLGIFNCWCRCSPGGGSFAISRSCALLLGTEQVGPWGTWWKCWGRALSGKGTAVFWNHRLSRVLSRYVVQEKAKSLPKPIETES